MIIVKAPYRISLFGGGSDFPEFIDKHVYGSIISCAIDKYAYTCIKKLLPFHSYKTKITYDRRERVYSSNKYISHPIFRNCIQFVGLEDEPLEINFISDVPSGSGLGTGSTMIVSLLKALYEYKNETINEIDLLNNAFYIERMLVHEPSGYQDYLPAIYGSLNFYEIMQAKDKVKINYIETFPKNFIDLIDRNGLLFYTGISRRSSVVINKYLGNITCENQKEIRYLCEQAYVMMKDKRAYTSFYELMNLSQSLKEKISLTIVTPEIKEKMDSIRNSGADAVRILGGGGGGSLFAFAEPARHYSIINAAKAVGCVHIPFEVVPRGVERIV